MERVMVLSNELIINNTIKRSLGNDVIFKTDEVNLNVINRFLNQSNPKILIIHHSVKCHNVAKLLEYLVTNKRMPVIYIHNTIHYGPFYNLVEDPYFMNLEESKLEVTLPLTTQLMIKVKKHFLVMDKEITTLKHQLNEDKSYHRAKYRLMEEKQMTEKEAHQFIIKEAMDKRMSKELVAIEILKKM